VTTIRYAVQCRICRLKWTENLADMVVTEGIRRPGARHKCAGMAESAASAVRMGLLPEALAITSKRVRWRKDPKRHPCGPDCWKAAGDLCHCDCRGEKHGILLIVPPPATEEEMDEFQRRLTPHD